MATRAGSAGCAVRAMGTVGAVVVAVAGCRDGTSSSQGTTSRHGASDGAGSSHAASAAAPVTPGPEESLAIPRADFRLTHLARDCDRGDQPACAELGSAYELGILGAPKDLAHAYELELRACHAGALRGCGYAAGQAIQSQDHVWAHFLAEKGCGRGNYHDTVACFHLGYLYSRGLGVPQNYARAVEVLMGTCDSQSYDACYELGELTAHGWGGPVDMARAARAYRNVCYAGEARGCVPFGRIVADGIGGMKKDGPHALELEVKACDDGLAEGCFWAGRFVADGKVGDQNPAAAVAHWQRGCDQGSLDSCAALGDSYATGTGTGNDAERARTLWRKACAGGHKSACERLAETPVRNGP